MTSTRARPLRSPTFGVSTVVLAVLLLFGATHLLAQKSYRIVLGPDQSPGGPLFSPSTEVEIEGRTDAPEGTEIVVVIGETEARTRVDAEGRFRLIWPEPLAGDSYTVVARFSDAGGSTEANSTEAILVVQERGRLTRRPLLSQPEAYSLPVAPEDDDLRAFTDRWRIVPPPTVYTAQGSRWDPYNQNQLKGDIPIRGDDLFLVLTGISDTLIDLNEVPVPSGISAARPSSIEFFGKEWLGLGQQNVIVSADLFKGDTAFKPIEWRVRATVVGNINYLEVAENAVVKPDVRRGTTRTDGRGSVQELFVEKKLKDLSPHYDFISVRAGIQPFSSDFRGFVYTDSNLGVRLFGNYDSNRTQYNLAYFERLEKDTNSGLNTFEWRDQQVVVANVYRQDFRTLGYTAEASLVYLRDEPTFKFDRNGFLARPDPAGSAIPHEIEALYLGIAGFGHFGRLNIDHALYYVTGDDSLNPIAGPGRSPGVEDKVDIKATMAALELSFDRDWMRPKFALFSASGDDDPTDRNAEGFDAIFDNPAFVGGGFSYWNRLGIRLAGSGVTLVNRGSLLPSLKSSKDEGQPNFVNPGLLLASLGLDIEVTPEIKAVATANYLRFATTETLELLLFQAPIDEEIGWDLSLGARWRPYLNNNVVLMAGVAALIPGNGFEAIYERDDPLFAGFTQFTLTF